MLNMVFLPLVTFLISPFVLWIHSMVGVVGLVEDGALRGAIVCNNDSWVTSKRRRETVWDNWTVGHFGSKKQISNIVDFQLSKWPSTKKYSKNISLIFLQHFKLFLCQSETTYIIWGLIFELKFTPCSTSIV